MASPPGSPIASSPSIGPMGETRLVDESECPKFRILIVGRSGTGKSFLINAIFGASLVDIKHNQAISADVNKGITSAHNKHLVIHDSEGYEPGNGEKVRVLEKFIKGRSQKERCDKLHAIWLCVTMPPFGGPTLDKWHEKIFELKLHKVPIIVVYTKFDLRAERLDEDGKEFTEISFKEKYGQKIEQRTRHSVMRQIPYTVVTTLQPETMQQLVKITMESIRHVNVEIPSPYIGIVLRDNGLGNGRSAASEEDPSDLAQDAFAMAQRVDTTSKISASIKRGKKKYWRAIASGIHFLGLSLRKCLYKMHKDIVAIWNIPNLDEYLLSDDFCRHMMAVVDDLVHQTQMNTNMKQGKIQKQGVAYLAIAWANNLYNRVPEHIRCLIGYVVDLTLILQAVFQVSLQDGPEKKITPDRVNEIIYEYHSSEKKKRIHDAIWEFTRTHSPATKDDVADVIESLINENQMKKNDIQFGQEKPAVLLLLAIIRLELTVKGKIVNRTTLHLMRKLLDLPEYNSLASELKADSDTELLLDFILYLFSNNGLSNSDIQDANKKARQLIFNLTSTKNVIPKSIFITDDVTTEVDSRDFAVGGLGRIFRGEHNKKKVTLKMFSRDHKEGSVIEVQRVIAWRSLVHSYILPLLGIFEMKPQLFLVSPYMANGTLTQWREKNQEPGIADKIHRMIREVAEGLEYIHSEGIVHCDLRGENIFLDSNLHCKIADTGLTQYTNAIITLSGSDFQFNYAAPELFVALSESDGPHKDHEIQGWSKTMQADVYAFGCLYYAIFFDTVPFKGKHEYQIMQLLINGGRPDRLNTPRMEDSTWNLIQNCWKGDPSQRPLMRRIVQKLISPGASQDDLMISLPGSIQEVYIPGVLTSFSDLTTSDPRPLANVEESASFCNQMAKNHTLCLIHKLSKPCETDITGLAAADAEGLLDSLSRLLCNNRSRNLGIQDANQKARRLMSKMISVTNLIPKLPKSLFITDVKIDTHLGSIGRGGFGRVFRGKYKGRQVAVKVVDKGRNVNSLIKDFCQEALTWRSLSHRFILPLLGIYEDESQLCLVSPFMANGTLTQWRKERTPDAVEVRRLMLEVAEGIQHLHTEGIVHGDLHGGNVLLDSEYHCKITDFGLTRHCEATIAASTRTFCHNFAAPELFGMCPICGEPECNDNHDVQHRNKTMETDVYAFGCLYYATFFGIVPFHDKTEFQIVRLSMDGKSPDRLESPEMADETWNLIQICWKSKPSERPTMDEIVETMKCFLS